MYRPLVSKIRCHNPNKNRSAKNNREYIRYVATREGVEILDSDELKHYYESNNEVYLNYMANRPRSHGLFGNIDTSNLSRVMNQVEDLTSQGKNIYRGIISLSPQDAEILQMTSAVEWQHYLIGAMPNLATQLGIDSTNFTWIAAFHAEASHPHVHYELWANADKVRSSYIPVPVQKRCRQHLEDSLHADQYEAIYREVFASERQELYQRKNTARDEIMDSFKDIFSKTEYVPGTATTTLPNRLDRETSLLLERHFRDLLDILPASGRLKYKLLPPETKDKVDEICNILFDHTSIKKAIQEYVNATGLIAKLSGATSSEISFKQSAAKSDLYRRSGNIILSAAKRVLENRLLEDPVSGDQITDQTDPPTPFDNQNDPATPYARYIVGKTLANKESEIYDPAAALNHFLSVADHPQVGDYARYAIGKLYVDKMSSIYNPQAALSYFRSVVDCDKPSLRSYAHYFLGKILLYESSCQNQSQGIEHLDAAIAEGNIYAQELHDYYYQNTYRGYIYSIFRGVFTCIQQEQHRQRQREKEAIALMSKKARKEKAFADRISHL